MGGDLGNVSVYKVRLDNGSTAAVPGRASHVDLEFRCRFDDWVDVVAGRLVAVPHAIIAAGNVMQGSRGGVDLPQSDIDRVKSHLAKYYKKMGEEAPWQHD